MPPTAVGGSFKSNLLRVALATPRIPPAEAGGSLKSSLLRVALATPRIPPTAVGGSFKSNLRLHFYPVVALGYNQTIRQKQALKEEINALSLGKPPCTPDTYP